MRGIQRRLASAASPTADLYFAHSCADMIAAAPSARWRSATVFETDRVVIVFRHDAGARLAAADGRAVVYVVDDAIFEGPKDRFLPGWYRAKLALVECEAARRILPRADAVVASSQIVAGLLPARLLRRGAPISVLGPYWRAQGADLAHFDRPDEIRIGYLGSSVHARGARFVCALIEALAAGGPRIRFSIAANHRVPESLRRICRLERLRFTQWPEYGARLARERFHICLYPLPDSGFSRGRSYNKVIEHALVGAAPVYSRAWGERWGVEHGGNGLLAEDGRPEWLDLLRQLTDDMPLARRIAAGAVALGDRLNRPDAQRDFWRRYLG